MRQKIILRFQKNYGISKILSNLCGWPVATVVLLKAQNDFQRCLCDTENHRKTKLYNSFVKRQWGRIFLNGTIDFRVAILRSLFLETVIFEMFICD